MIMKMNSTRKIGMLIAVLACAAETLAATPMSRTELQIQNKVRETFSQLTDLEPWQRKLLSEEILPHYKRYIKSSSEGAGRVDVEVDREQILRSLTFYAPTYFGGATEAKVLSWVIAPASCEKCQQSVAGVTQVWKIRTQRRAWVSVWNNKSSDATYDPESDDGSPELGWEQKLADQAQKQGFQSMILVMLLPNPDHPGDHLLKVALKTFNGKKSFRKTASTEILGSDTFETAFGSIVSDFMLEMGSPQAAAIAGTGAFTADGQPHEGIRVDVSGVRRYEQFQKVKQLLQQVAGPEGSVIERKLARGQAQWVIFADLAKDKLKTEEKILSVSKISNAPIHLEKSREPGSLDSDLHFEVKQTAATQGAVIQSEVK